MLNIYKSSSLLIPLILIMSSGCGGGGGDGDDARNISGVWKGSLTQESDTCGTRSALFPKIVAASGTFTHTVNQNEDAVDLNDGIGTSFLGNVVGDDGFSVDAATKQDNSINGNVTCDETQRISYDDIVDDSDATASVRLTTNKECSDGINCQVISTGAATRDGGAPAPADDNNNVDDATDDDATERTTCNDLVEREYSGDSGCNISQITTSTNGNVILLNPLGANGATSFSISSEDSTIATAENMDLQIMGSTGYACAIKCSGIQTFTLKCFKEGGAVCSEKF